MPLVSILIPTYNRANLIHRAIDSALAQTFRDFEIVIVDNCSTDNTLDILLEYERKFPKTIRVFQNSENLGPVMNWKKCASLAQAPFCKIIFSDDMIQNDYLEKTVPEIINPNCGLVYTPAMVGFLDWEGSTHYKAFQNNTQISRDHFVRLTTLLEHFCPVSPGAALFRTIDLQESIFSHISGIDYDFSGTGAGVDWLIYPLIALKYKYVSYVSESLVYFHAHSDSISIKNENNSIPLGYALAKKWFTESVPGI